MGGHSLSAHTGFVCAPEYAVDAITTFSNFIQKQLKWDIFEMREVFDPRFDVFLSYFSSRKFSLRRISETSCPYIPLPQSWDQYLQDCLSTSARKELRKKIRWIERDTRFVRTQADDHSLDEDIETLLALWQSRWGAKPDHLLDMIRAVYTRCYESNSLHLSTLRCESTPVAARAGFIDREKHKYYGYMVGWNNDFRKLSPGMVMFGYAIRYAIENGLVEYDFGRGNSDFKFSMGSRERLNTNVIITRRNFRRMLKTQSHRIKRKLRIA